MYRSIWCWLGVYYGVVYSTIIIGMFRYIVIIIYEVPTACSQRLSRLECGPELARPRGSLGPSRASRKVTWLGLGFIVGLRIRVIVRYTQYTRYSRRYTRYGQCSRRFYYWQQYLSSTRPYVQREVKDFHWINLYLVDKNASDSPNSYPLNSDLSGGKLKCYGQAWNICKHIWAHV